MAGLILDSYQGNTVSMTTRSPVSLNIYVGLHSELSEEDTFVERGDKHRRCFNGFRSDRQADYTFTNILGLSIN